MHRFISSKEARDKEDVMGSGGNEIKVQNRRRAGKIKRHTKEAILDAHIC